MTHFDYPTASFVTRDGSLCLDFFAALLHMGYVIPIRHGLERGFARIPFVGTQVFIYVFWTLNNDFIKHKFKLAYVMPVGPGHDD